MPQSFFSTSEWDLRGSCGLIITEQSMLADRLELRYQHLVCSSDRCGRSCRRPYALRRARVSVFMRVAALEHLVQNHVGWFGVPAAAVNSWKQMVGERGFEPPTPWSRTRFQRLLNSIEFCRPQVIGVEGVAATALRPVDLC